MSRFPIKESSIVELCEIMINGFTEHDDDFPSCPAAGLTSILADYKESRDSMVNAQSQTKLAVETKDTSLEVLMTTMKDYLKKAETDVTAQPEKLSEIGWGPRSQPQPLTPPGQPDNLHPVAEGNGMIYLSWDKPATGAGGDVWNYVMERRQQNEAGQFGDWSFAGSFYNCEANLTDQPVNARVEYRVKSVNSAGESMPSNSVSVVLP